MTASNRTNWLRRIVLPPHFEDEDTARSAQFLNAILLAGIMLLGIRLIVGALINQHFTPGETLLLFLIPILVVLLVVMRRGYVRAASIVLLGLLIASMVLVAQSADGIHDGAFLVLTAIVVMASLLIGWKASAVVAALSIAAGWWLAQEYNGIPQTLPSDSSTSYAGDAAVVFVLLVVLMYLVVSSLQRSVQRSRAAEQSLRQQNLELTQLQATLEQRVAERTDQLRAAADVGRVASSILDARQLMSEVVNLIATRFGFYYAAIFTLDSTGSYLILREATGEAGRVLLERGHRLRVGLDSMVGYAATQREPRVALNAGEDTVRFANPLLPDTQSEIALPLMVGDQVLGALDVQAATVDAFDEAVIATLQSMAAQIAIALQNAESYKRLQQTLELTTRQYELSRTIITASTPTEVYESLGQVFAMLSDIDRISLLRVADRDAQGQPTEYEVATEWDVLGGAQFDSGQRFSAAETPFAQLVAPDEVTVIHDSSDNRLPLSTREQLAQAGAQAVLLMPLTMRGQYEGFIAAVTEQAHDFEDNEVRLMQSAAEQLSVVLSNLQLTAEMQKTLERVALLNRQLSGEAWGSYLKSSDQLLVESGHVQPAALNDGLQVPIVIRGETIGTFDVADDRSDREWREEEVTMLQTIAGEVALAVENARLIEQTQRTAQREKDIATAANKIHRSMDIETVLQSAVAELQRITGRRGISVQLGFGRTKPTVNRMTGVDAGGDR